MQDLYSTGLTQETCGRSFRSYVPHQENTGWTTLDYEVMIDYLVWVHKTCCTHRVAQLTPPSLHYLNNSGNLTESRKSGIFTYITLPFHESLRHIPGKKKEKKKHELRKNRKITKKFVQKKVPSTWDSKTTALTLETTQHYPLSRISKLIFSATPNFQAERPCNKENHDHHSKAPVFVVACTSHAVDKLGPKFRTPERA